MMRAPWLVVAFATVALIGCGQAAASPSASPSPPRVALATASPIAVPSPTAAPTPGPTSSDQPSSILRYLPIDALALSDDGRRVSLTFVGLKAFSADDPCSAEYAAVTAVVDGVLDIRVYDPSRQVDEPVGEDPIGCDAIGYGRSLEVDLPTPFTGVAWRDGRYLHFLGAPPGLVELALPTDRHLVGERDVEESPTGRWERTYAASPDAPRERSIVLYQSFDGPVNVSGGQDRSQVSVNGRPATLYRSPEDGELVLVWELGDDGLALVAYEHDLSVGALIALAESANATGP